MQTVTENYKKSVLSDTDNSKLLINFSFIPEGSKENATLNGSALVFGNIADINDNISDTEYKLATFEKAELKLDGTYKFPRKNESIGVIFSPISDDKGAFGTKPWIEYILDKPYDIIGGQMWFDEARNLYANSFTVTYYSNNNTILTTKTYTNTEAVRQIDLTGVAVKKINVTFNSLNEPHRHLRLTEVSPGQIFIFNDSNLFSAEITEEITPYETNLPIPIFRFSFDNSQKKFDINNPSGIVNFLRTDMLIDAKMTIANTVINICDWNFATWNDDQVNEITSLGFSPSINNAGDYLIETHGKQTFGQLANYIFGTVIVPDSIKNLSLNENLGSKINKKSAAALLAIAGNGYFKMNRNGTYEFKQIDFSNSVRDIDYSVQFEKSEMEQTEYITSVNVPYTVWSSETDSDGKVTWNSEEIDCITGTLEGMQLTINSGFIADINLAKTVGANALKYFKNRVKARVNFKGDPSLEICDTVKIENDYGLHDTIILKQRTTYGGILETEIEGIGK